VLNRRSIRSVLIYVAFLGGVYGLPRLAQYFHVGGWFNALPLQYQVPAGIAFVLVFTVLPFAAMVVVLSRRGRNSERPQTHADQG
jgi:hypothetical protein